MCNLGESFLSSSAFIEIEGDFRSYISLISRNPSLSPIEIIELGEAGYFREIANIFSEVIY